MDGVTAVAAELFGPITVSGDSVDPVQTQAQATDESLLNAELKWLLETQTPPIVGEIETIIKSFNTSRDIDKWTDDGSLLVIRSSDLVKGFVTVDGTAIVKGELTLKLPHYNRGNALKVAINPSQPAYLQQLITVQNYLVLAQQAFVRVPRSARNRAGLLKLLTKVSTCVRKASKALSRVREADTFPAKECDAKCFSPDLPEDLIVEFFVKHSSLMVSIRALNFQQQGIPLQIQSKILGKFRNMRIETYKGRPVEILDELTVGSASPRLVTLIRSLNTIAGLCEDMHMKLQMFK
ncbi:hypothetical protein PhCBS80983_g00740 [Powellomyces hirtus]|uniref:Uncharacterized protein n=1 Tax=Powellomyces hirtus TaxID=109895 RepID=A0A507EG47_9FUNG|nr:hypothetical protein PhCBS80983_g00740 [Powellomyces hirtus]